MFVRILLHGMYSYAFLAFLVPLHSDLVLSLPTRVTQTETRVPRQSRPPFQTWHDGETCTMLRYE